MKYGDKLMSIGRCRRRRRPAGPRLRLTRWRPACDEASLFLCLHEPRTRWLTGHDSWVRAPAPSVLGVTRSARWFRKLAYMIPDLDRVTSPAYLANLLTRPIGDIRSMRAEGQSIENGMSYVRRVAQGRIDIVAAELQRRRNGGDPADLSELVAQLPDILSRSPTLGRTYPGARTKSPSIEWPTSCSTISTPFSGSVRSAT